GVTGGAGTLADEVLTLAGFENRARTIGIEGWRRLARETLLMGGPDFLVTDDLGELPPSLGRALLEHPALSNPQTRRIELSGNQWVCPGATVLTAIEALAAARLAAAPETGAATGMVTP